MYRVMMIILYVFEKLGHSWNIVFPLFSPVEILAIILTGKNHFGRIERENISALLLSGLGSPFLQC